MSSALTAPSKTPRASICIDCRTLLGPDEACDGGAKHRTAPLATKAGRSSLLREVWGPPSVRRRAKQLAKAGGGGLGVGSILDGCGSCGDCAGADLGGEALAVVGVLLIAVVAFIALYWIIAKTIEWVRAYQNRPKPNGGVVRPASLGRKAGPAGVVVGEPAMLAPATGKPCLAWALDLRSKRFLGSDIMLHDAETGGFSIKLDDGTVARIPAGRVRIEGPHERIDRSDAEPVESFVAGISHEDDPEDAGLAPFPYDTVDEVLVRPGDRVRLFGELEREVDPNAPGDYRAAAVVVSPRGVPALRVERAGPS